MSHWDHTSFGIQEENCKTMYSKLGWLPVLLFANTVIAFGVSYAIAVYKHAVQAWWPYISDTGAKPPESCIFGQLLNITALLAFLVMFVRYKLVQSFNNHSKSLRVLNKTGLAVGALSGLGVSLVANFQDVNVISVHVIGAMMAFALGTLYCFLHAAITRKMYPMYNNYRIFIIRLFFSFISLTALICTSVFGLIATHEHDNSKFANQTHWTMNVSRSDPALDSHIASTVSEWTMGVVFIIYFLTFVKDFQKITMRILPELLVSHLDETPIVFINNGPTERTGLLA